MSSTDLETEPPLPIGAVERETGLSKDVLRKWEVRYGFPLPERDAGGERVYPAEQVARLRLIKRLLDSGLRPARVVAQPLDALAALVESRQPAPEGELAAAFGADLIDLIRRHDAAVLRQTLVRLMHRQGLERFVQDTVADLVELVGEAWARGELDVHDEHLFSEVLQGVLRGVVDALNEPGGRPRILLTTLPGESHGQGLLMVAALAALDGAHCLTLGPQTPAHDIRNAVDARAIDIVALSFSSTFPSRQVTPAIAALRESLPGHVEIWVGGRGAGRASATADGVTRIAGLEALLPAIAGWRAKSSP